jgi:hypothetical protein
MTDLVRSMRRILGEELPTPTEVSARLAEAKIEAEVAVNKKGRVTILAEGPQLTFAELTKIAKLLNVRDFEVVSTSSLGLMLVL